MEHSSFTPLVFSTTGSLGSAACSFYKRMISFNVNSVAEKWNQPYHACIALQWVGYDVDSPSVFSAL